MPRRREDVNERIDSILTHNTTRAAAHSASEASGVTIDTTTTISRSGAGGESSYSTSNLRALSQVIAELCERLDDVLQEISAEDEDEDDENGYSDYKFLDYIEKIESYTNHRLPMEALTPFSLLIPEWQRVLAAAELSKTIRKATTSTATQTLVPASWNGSRKTMMSEVVDLNGTRVLNIAIRGTVSKMDWAVNSNGAPVQAPELGENMLCHRGFLDVARRMEKMVVEAISKVVALPEPPLDLVFTGHSAGGAVAQILFGFAHSAVATALKRATVGFHKIDCITFASPPSTVPPIPCPEHSLFLSFINEGDPVGLAQPEYVTSLLEAYARPLMRAPTHLKVPEPKYRISGKCVVLKDVAPDEEEDVQPGAFTVEPGYLYQALFGDPVMHSMKVYLDRVSVLLELAQEGVVSSVE